MAIGFEHTRVIRFCCEAHSQESEGFRSENEQSFRVIDTVRRYIGSFIYIRCCPN